MTDDPNDFLDVKIRLVRGESPILYRALEAIESRPGSRTRTLYFRQLAEMGLMMQEERMRVREPGLSSRPASALARDLTASATPAAGASAAQAAPTPAPSPPVPAAQAPARAAPRPALPLAAPALQAAPPPAAPEPLAPAAGDGDRPAPRVVGQGGSRRLLGGDDYE